MNTRHLMAALALAIVLPLGSSHAESLEQTLGMNDATKPFNQIPTSELLFKDPMIASLMSASLPGLGQVYAGQKKRGLLFFIGTVGAFGTAVGLAEPAHLELSDYDRSAYGGNDDGLLGATEIENWEEGEFQDDAFKNLSDGRKAGAITSGVIGLGLYVWNIIDARGAARAHNETARARRIELGFTQGRDHTALALNLNF